MYDVKQLERNAANAGIGIFRSLGMFLNEFLVLLTKDK